jgi:DNA mismatch endonuclease, patch repair protein
MARIRATHTSPERILRQFLWRRGAHYRLHVTTPHGRPDLVFKRQQVAVFIDGCFWHGCPEHYVFPRSRQDFWRQKLAVNVERDCRQTVALEHLGWRVCRLWEHQVFEDPEGSARIVLDTLQARIWTPEPIWRVVQVGTLDLDGQIERRHLRELRGVESDRTCIRRRTTHKWRAARILEER